MSIRNIFTRSIARENGRAIRRLTQRVTNSTREFWRQFLLQFGDASFRGCCASLHPEIPPNKKQISPSRSLIPLGYLGRRCARLGRETTSSLHLGSSRVRVSEFRFWFFWLYRSLFCEASVLVTAVRSLLAGAWK
ncbi:unnamed protein product [Musa acuminata var. zebrina]